MSQISGLDDGDALELVSLNDEIAAEIAELNDELNSAQTIADLTGNQSEVIRIQSEIRSATDTAFFNAQGGNYNNAAEFYASLDTASKNRIVSGNTSSIETGAAVDANDPNQYVEVQMKTDTGGIGAWGLNSMSNMYDDAIFVKSSELSTLSGTYRLTGRTRTQYAGSDGYVQHTAYDVQNAGRDAVGCSRFTWCNIPIRGLMRDPVTPRRPSRHRSRATQDPVRTMQ